ncbi:MAG: cupin domain-containing protein [Planctomycetes bacterium]|nr:cupin domain-containing protein [Planctomycetota bacterium]
MATLEGKSLNSPDETMTPPNARIDTVKLGGVASFARVVLQPGWRWSEHMKPIAGTESCPALHTGYVVSGRLRVRMDDGTEGEFGASDAAVVPPGHDAWVVGDEPCVMVDFTAGEELVRYLGTR